MSLFSLARLNKLKKAMKANARAVTATDLLRAHVRPPGPEGVTRDLQAAIGKMNTVEKRLDAFDASRRGRNSTERLRGQSRPVITERRIKSGRR